MNDTIRNAFKALDELLEVKIEPVKSRTKRLKEAEDFDDIETPLEDIEVLDVDEPAFIEDAPEDKTLREMFEEAGAYVLTHEFEHNGLQYSLFIEGLKEGEAADVVFDEFDISNIDGVLVEVLDAERDFIGNISEGHPEWKNLDVLVSEIELVAKEEIESPEDAEEPEELEGEEVITSPDLSTEEKIEKHIIPDHSESDVVTEEMSPNTKFFPGNEGDVEAAMFVEQQGLSDYDFHWDESREGYVLTWENPEELEEEKLSEDKMEGRQKFNKHHKLFAKVMHSEATNEDLDEPELPLEVVIDGSTLVDDVDELEGAYLDEEISDWLSDNYGFLHTGFDYEVQDGMVYVKNIKWDTGESLKESAQFDIKDPKELKSAKEELENQEEDDVIEQVVDINAESVEDLKKTYIGDAILRCPTCKTMIYKELEKLVKPEDQEDGLYNEGEECPHCGATDGFESVGQVAKLTVNPQGEEAPSEEPAMEEPVKEESPESQEAESQEEEEVPAEGGPTVSIIPEEEEEVKESLTEESKTWGVYQTVEAKRYKQDPTLTIGFIIKGLTKEEAEQMAKDKNTPETIAFGVTFEAKPDDFKSDVDVFNNEKEKERKNREQMKEEYQDIILESLDEIKFDRLAKKYLSEVYSNIESYVTVDGYVDNKNNKVIIEGKIKFKSGKLKDTKFVFEAKEITKKGKIKLVGINETFATKKAFTLVGAVIGSKLLSESLTYSYKVADKKVYGQVKNPTRISRI